MVKNKKICDIKIEFTEKPSIVLDAPEWVAKIKYIKNANSLICWNPSETYIFTLPINS